MTTLRRLAPLLAAALFACGEDAPPAPALTAAQYQAALKDYRLNLSCTLAFDCPAEGYKPRSLDLWLRRYPDKAACLASARLSNGLDAQVAQIDLLLTEQRVDLSGVDAAACISALQRELDALGCGVLHAPTPAACRDTLAGKRAQGQRCSYASDCVDGQECDETGYCDGQCIPRTCGAQTCTGDTTCIEDAQGLRACAPPANPGESCAELPCAQGSSCSRGDTNVCVAFGSLNDGAPCSDDRQCKLKSYCDDQNRCAPAQVVGAGKPCVRDGLPTCAGGLACVDGKLDAATLQIVGKCGAPLAAGAACYSDAECGADLRCVGVSLGVAGACSSLRANGESCSGDADCASGVCRLNAEFEPVCVDAANAPQDSCPLPG